MVYETCDQFREWTVPDNYIYIRYSTERIKEMKSVWNHCVIIMLFEFPYILMCLFNINFLSLQ